MPRLGSYRTPRPGTARPANVRARMRVVDLDRDMRDVIPTSTSPDSDYLFEQMTRRTLHRARGEAGTRVLDVASGFGQDARALAQSGAVAVAAEPSARMSALAVMQDA